MLLIELAGRSRMKRNKFPRFIVHETMPLISTMIFAWKSTLCDASMIEWKKLEPKAPSECAVDKAFG
jgi:hypothetical protein